jgi:hypothetical protein
MHYYAKLANFGPPAKEPYQYFDRLADYEDKPCKNM